MHRLVLLFLAMSLGSVATFAGDYQVSSVRYMPAGDAVGPKVASDGDGFFMVWNNAATRVDRNGAALDHPPFDPGIPESNAGVEILADPDGFLLLTLDRSRSIVELTKLSPDLGHRSRTLVPLPHPAHLSTGLDAATNGSVIFAVYRNLIAPFSPLSYEIRFALLTLDGTHIRSGSLGWNFGRLDVATNGKDFLLLDGSKAHRFSEDGVLLGSTDLPFFGFSASGDASGYLVVGRRGNHPTHELAIARLSAAGSITFGPTTFAEARFVRDASIGRLGNEYVVVWKDVDHGPVPLNAARIRSDGTLIERQTLSERSDVAGHFQFPSDDADVASHGDALLFAWSEGNSNFDFSYRNVTRVLMRRGDTLASLEKQLTSIRATDQTAPAVTRNGSNLLTAWSETTDSIDRWFDPRIRASISTARGALLREVTLPESGDRQSTPVVAWDGKSSLIVWSDEAIRDGQRIGKTVGVRVDPRGDVVERVPFTVASAIVKGHLSCASSGTCLFLFEANRIQDAYHSAEVYAARIHDGVVLDPEGTLIATPTFGLSSLTLETNGENFIAVWVERPVAYGSLIRRANIHITASSLRTSIDDIAAVTGGHAGIEAEWNGEKYLIVWGERSADTIDYRIRGSFLSREGHSLDGGQTGWRGFVIRETGAAQMIPSALLWDGSAFHLNATGSRNTLVFRLSREGGVIDESGHQLPRNAILLEDGTIAAAMSLEVRDRRHLHAQRVRLRLFVPRHRGTRRP